MVVFSSDADKAELLKSRLAETFNFYTEIQAPQNNELVKQYLDTHLAICQSTKSFTPNDVNLLYKNTALINPQTMI